MQGLLPVGRRRNPFETFEELREIGGVESETLRDPGNGIPPLPQHLTGLFHQLVLKKITGGIARSELDRIAQVHRVNVQDRRKILNMIHLIGLAGEDVSKMLVYFSQEIPGDFCLPG